LIYSASLSDSHKSSLTFKRFLDGHYTNHYANHYASHYTKSALFYQQSTQTIFHEIVKKIVKKGIIVKKM